MPFIETAGGVRLHYETAGEGVPLLFIHGWAMSGKVWRIQEGYADSNRLVIPDLRGHGLSSAPAAGYSLEDFAADLAALFDVLQLDKAVLIGWSMGVLVALEAFHLLRERLAALVLVSGTPRFTVAADYPHGLPPVEPKGLGLLLKRDFRNAVGDFFWGMFAKGELEAGEQYRLVFQDIMVQLPARHAALESLASLAGADLRSVLPTVDRPVLLIHGSADTICLPSASRFMAERLPNARLAMVEGAGHAPFLSRPADFALLLREFLDGIHA